MTDKKVYRATADYGDRSVTRHFLTKRARDEWAARRLEGYPEQMDTNWDFEGDSNGRDAIPPANWVDLWDSDPVTFSVNCERKFVDSEHEER